MSRVNPWILGLTILWAAIAIPVVAIGADDFEEYFTAVTTTRMAVTAMAGGAWPFWNLDLGLGAPQPLRFHFITHPLSPLCLATDDCHGLLRAIATLHVLAGAVFMGLIGHRITGNRALAGLAALSYCFSSSVIQPMYTDDWPITAMNESALPVMLYAVLALGDAADRWHRALWMLVLGGVAGYGLSTSFPVVTLMVITIVALSLPGVLKRLPWLIGAAAITVLMGAAHFHHIASEFLLTPATVVRTNHDDPQTLVHLWSTFARPLPLIHESRYATWRTIFIGPPLAVAALIALFRFGHAGTRPIRVGLIVGILGFIVPPAFLFNINTAQWTFRTELNVFGILLGVYGIHRLTSPDRSTLRAGLVALQIVWGIAAIALPWYEVFAMATGITQPGPRILRSPGIAEEIADRYRVAPGRVALAPEAYLSYRKPFFNMAGLGTNQLPQMGIPVLSGVMFGITTDSLYPLRATLEGEVILDQTGAANRPLLDVLGVRYLFALANERVPEGLPEIGSYGYDLRLYENASAWPPAFFVEGQLPARLPILEGCAHKKFLCSDFGRGDIRRASDPLRAETLGDGFRLSFPAADRSRTLLITQWYRDGWTITEGQGSVFRAVDQLVGVQVPAGETQVAVRFRPRLRAALFGMGLASEMVVGLTVLAMLITRRVRTHGRS